MSEQERIARTIEKIADRYEKDGEPGDLGSVWGWRTIAEHLRKAANEVRVATK